jgi:hypothetical protein
MNGTIVRSPAPDVGNRQAAFGAASCKLQLRTTDNRTRRPGADNRTRRPGADRRTRRPGADRRTRRPGADRRTRRATADRHERCAGGGRNHEGDPEWSHPVAIDAAGPRSAPKL